MSKKLLKADGKIIRDALSDDELEAVLDNPKIIKYSELANYGSIDELLPNDKDYVILLFEQQPNVGHWVGLLKYNDTIEYYDSYAKPPEYPLRWSREYNNQLRQYPKLLENLLSYNNNYKIIYNKKRVQSLDPNVKTCGRHLASRIKFMLDYDYDLNKYNKLLESMKKKLNTSYDDIVAYLIENN